MVQWLGFGAFTAAAGVRFPAWENIFPVLHLEEYCLKCTFFVFSFFVFFLSLFFFFLFTSSLAFESFLVGHPWFSGKVDSLFYKPSNPSIDRRIGGSVVECSPANFLKAARGRPGFDSRPMQPFYGKGKRKRRNATKSRLFSPCIEERSGEKKISPRR